MERMRQLVGEMLIYCFVVALASGAFLAYFYVPSGRMVPYGGSYEPLRNIPMSAAYDSVLKISLDVRGGVFMRQLHHQSSVLLVVGTVVWALLGRFRYAFALAGLGLSLLGALAGYGSADDLLADTVLGRIPVLLWYGLHLLAALALGVALVASSRREAVSQPRTPAFMALSLCLAVLVIFWL
ncbi:hypothetical protein [Nonomuraea helvata]|uniref:Cytochrome bc1 complex cytochrome b subunit n=1 Tax=Nonomuraea helvata TaxID=37484 RepID=A0ABV5RRP6_9ACTN